MKFLSFKKISIFYLLAAALLVSVLFIFYFNNTKVKSTNLLVEQTQNIIKKNNDVLIDVLNLETGARGYLLSGNKIFLAPYNNAVQALNKNIAQLLVLTKPKSLQQLKVDSLFITVNKELVLTHKMVSAKKENDFSDAEKIDLIEKGKTFADELREIVLEINTDAFSILKQQKAANEKTGKNAELFFLMLIAFIIVIFGFVVFLNNNQQVRNDELQAATDAQKLLSKYSLSLIEASLDPLVTINTAGKITDTNEATVNVTGISKERLIGSDFFDYFTEPHKAREVYKEVFAKGSVADSPLTLRHNTGKLTDVLFNGSVYKDDSGNVMGIVIVARDVTAQKIANRYARSLIEASLDPLFTIGVDGKITDMNDASVKVTGTCREKLINTDFFEYFTEPDKAREVYQQVFANGFVSDYPLTIRDVELTDVLFNGSVYKDVQGNVLGVVVVARDITDQKRIEKELIEAKVFAELATKIADEAKNKAEYATIIAENAVKAKQQFLSNMSHEIRTPMNAIIGFTKVVLKTDLTAKQKEYLTAIKMSGDTLIVLINDILDLAKVDAGKMLFEQIPFKVAASLSSMLHLFETKIQEKNLLLIKEYDKKIPEVLVGDPVRLHQIILNLMSNAVKFTAKGSITVSVDKIKEDELTSTVKFTVADTGIGIPHNKIDSIFENFQQASSGTSRLFGGTGLGLAIVKQLVEAQGGTITVKSIEGEGASFSFILKFKKTKEEAEVTAELLVTDPGIKNLKVLVVEDMALNQLLMKTLLDDFGFEREIAGNGIIAIEKLETNSYDIILMDLQMPEMNGFEATEYIRNVMKSDIPIIALTADVTTVDLAKCKLVGMNDYLAKPVDERLLYSKIIGLVKKTPVIKPAPTIKNELAAIKNNRYTNLEYLMLRTKSNAVLMQEMIGIYLEQTPSLVKVMTKSFRDKDWVSLKAAIHKMIPSFAIMGMSINFENMAKKVQEYVFTQQHSNEIEDIIKELEIVCTRSCEELAEEYNRLKKVAV